MSTYPDFADLLNTQLREQDRTISWLARRLGVNHSTVSRWLNLDTRPADPETVVRIADILGVHTPGDRQKLLLAAGYGYLESPSADGDQMIKTSVQSESSDAFDLSSREHKATPPRTSPYMVPVLPPHGLLGDPVPTTKHNLPPQGTAFFGRTQELAMIHARLAQPDCRLLTLLGPGGIGKTRLAHEAARQEMGYYADGIYLVQLAPVESPAFVVQALAEALDLALTNERDPLERVVNYLREKSLLLVLDNFEHLLEDVDLLAEILNRSKVAKLLVTSRERLGFSQEWVFDVQGLSYPTVEGQDMADIDPVNYDAGQLFLSTAQRVKAGFAPDDHDRVEISRICQAVGGMPLGIELAASWVRLLSCADIARGIAQNLDMLTTSWRDVPERHRSLQAVLDHSWNLLAVDELEAFCRLTVFGGPFGHAAAAVVADASLNLLLALVDKSFLQRDDRDRFVIHELVKQYGNTKLRANPDIWSTAQLLHCRYHAAFLVECMSAPDARLHLDEVAEIFDDLQMAWRYAVENQQLTEIQQFSTGFLIYYRLHSWYRAGTGAVALYQQAVACFDPNTRIPDELAALSRLHESIGELQELASTHEDALAAFQTALRITPNSDHIRRGRLSGRIADVWVSINRHELGHKCYTEAEAMLSETSERGFPWWREWLRIQTQRMELYYWQNRPDDMDEHAHRIRASVEEHGTAIERGRFVHLLGTMSLRRDRYFQSSDAIVYSGEALALSQKSGNLGEIADRHFYHGFSQLWSDQFEEAETHLQIAREMGEQSGDLTLVVRAVTYLTLIYRRRDDLERARAYAIECLRISSDVKMPQYTGAAHAHFAWLAWRADDVDETVRQAQSAIEDWGGLGEGQSVVVYRWYALLPLMDVALDEENIEQAVEMAQLLIAPSQMRLPDELTNMLAEAVAAGRSAQWEMASDLLRQGLDLARNLHYL